MNRRLRAHRGRLLAGLLGVCLGCGDTAPDLDFRPVATVWSQGNQAASVELDTKGAGQVAVRITTTETSRCVGATRIGGVRRPSPDLVPRGRGSVAWMFPMPDLPLNGSSVPLSLGTFDCVTGAPVPGEVRFEVERLDHEPAIGPLTLPLRLHLGTGIWALPEPVLNELIAGAAGLLSTAQLHLELSAVDNIELGPKVSLSNARPPSTLLADARQDAAALDVFLVACIEHEDALTRVLGRPEGHALAAPAGLTRLGHPDGVLLQYGSCGTDPWLPEVMPRLARVLAHEIGHALGLTHSVDADGRQDRLPDTEDYNLMYWAIGEQPIEAHEALSVSQIDRIRGHPLLTPR